MKRTSFSNRKVQVGLFLSLVILVVGISLAYRGMSLSSESVLWVEHSHDVLQRIDAVGEAFDAAEAAFLGRELPTSDNLQTYTADIRLLAQDEEALQKLIVDNPTQRARLARLDRLVSTYVVETAALSHLQEVPAGRPGGAAYASDHERLVADVRSSLREFRDEEQRLLKARQEKSQRRFNLAKAVILLGSVMGFLVAGVAVWRLRRDYLSRTVTEHALRESEARYRMLVDSVTDYAIFVLSPEGTISSWNVGAERILGYSAAEMTGLPFSCLYSPEDVKRGWPQEVLRLTAADGRHEEQGMRFRKNGERFLATVIFTALYGPAGELMGYSNVSRDLSESKESGAKYRGLLEAAPDAMVVVDPLGEIVLVNVQAEKQFGYRRDELIGQQVKNIIPEGFAERLIADGTRTAADALAQQIGTGIELSGRRKDGSAFPIEIMLSPLESAEGTLITAAIRNISVRKQAERVLEQMESRYRGLLEAAPDAMVVVDQEGKIVLLNIQAEKQFGYRRDELLGQQVKNIIPEGFAERQIADALRSAEDAVAQQIGTGIELSARRKDGSEFPIEIMLSPLESSEGILVTTAIRDITGRKKAESLLLHKVAELNRSNVELGQFAYIASHDLQEPLRMVASYTQLLSRRYKGRLDADADDFIAYAVDGASRMQRLIRDLLMFSRVETAGKELLVTSSEEALEQAITNLRGAVQDSGAVITHDPLPSVLADEMQLVQLFQNLVGNGIKYTKAGVPAIHISVLVEKKRCVFSVKDEGLGIDPQYFEKIFGMFQRLHKREEFAGTGIGLAICKKIVERYGGDIWVESEPGHGSTFRFSLMEGVGKA